MCTQCDNIVHHIYENVLTNYCFLSAMGFHELTKKKVILRFVYLCTISFSNRLWHWSIQLLILIVVTISESHITENYYTVSEKIQKLMTILPNISICVNTYAEKLRERKKKYFTNSKSHLTQGSSAAGHDDLGFQGISSVSPGEC